LKQWDKDGKFTYSKVVAIPFSNELELTIWSAQNSLFIDSPENLGAINLLVSNVLGQVISSQRLDIQQGKNQFPLFDNWQNQILIFQLKEMDNGRVWSGRIGF